MKKSFLGKALLFILVSLLFVACSSKKDGKDGMSEADLAAQNDSRFGDGNIPLSEQDGLFRNIYFDYDSSRVNDRGRQDIEYNVEVLKQHSDLKITLEGHCDIRGTKEYNMALGSRRAQAVADVLGSYGIARSRVTTISYGAEIPLDPASDESAYAKNRRVHFGVTK